MEGLSYLRSSKKIYPLPPKCRVTSRPYNFMRRETLVISKRVRSPCRRSRCSYDMVKSAGAFRGQSRLRLMMMTWRFRKCSGSSRAFRDLVDILLTAIYSSRRTIRRISCRTMSWKMRTRIHLGILRPCNASRNNRCRVSGADNKHLSGMVINVLRVVIRAIVFVCLVDLNKLEVKFRAPLPTKVWMNRYHS